jgi:hypothetical protein
MVRVCVRHRFAEMSTFEARVPVVVLVIHPGNEKKAEETVKFKMNAPVVSSLSNLSSLGMVVQLGEDPLKMCNGVLRVATDMGAFWYDYKLTALSLKGSGNGPGQLDIFKIIGEHRKVIGAKCNVTFGSADEAPGVVRINLSFVYSKEGMRGRYVDLIFTGKRDLPTDPDARLGTVRLNPRLVEMLVPGAQRQ